MGTTEPGQLSPLQIKRALNRNILASSFGVLFATCLSLQFVTQFAIQMGATKFQLGLLTSLPLLVYPLQLVSAYLTERIRRRKRFWFILSVIYRMLWLPMVAIPFVIGREHKDWQLCLFFSLYFLTNGLAALTVPPWFSWMADLVPAGQAGRFWNRRSAVLNAVMLSSLICGKFVDSFDKNSMVPFAVLFVVGVLLGELDLVIHYGIPEPPMRDPPQKPALWSMLKEPLRNPQFRRFLWFNCTLSFAATVSNAYVMVFFLEVLKLPQLFICILVSAMLLARIFMARYWGFIADRFGHTAVNTICDFCLIFVPLGYIFVTPSNCMWSLFILHILAGIFNIGLETSSTTLMLSLSTSENKSMFVAVLMSLVGVVAASAPLFGGWILHSFEGIQTQFALWQFNNFQVLFLIGFLLRLIMFPFSLRLDDIGGSSTSLVVRRLMDTNPFRVIRHIHVLSESSAETERVAAVQELGSARSSIATRQLILALDDPSLEVRQEAVSALARIGDSESVQPLIQTLRSAESGIQSQAAFALGKLRDARAAPALIEALAEPHLAQASAVALGEIADRSAIEPLFALLRDSNTAESTRASIAQALSRMGETSALPDIFEALQNTRSPVVRRQMALAIGNLFGRPGEFYRLLSRERQVAGQEIMRLHGQIMRDQKRFKSNPSLIERALREVGLAQTRYNAEQWHDASQAYARAGLLLAGSHHEEETSDRLFNFLTDRFDPYRRKVEEQLAHRDAGSAPLWFLLAIAYPQSNETRSSRQEETLLAFYAFWRIWIEKAG